MVSPQAREFKRRQLIRTGSNRWTEKLGHSHAHKSIGKHFDAMKIKKSSYGRFRLV